MIPILKPNNSSLESSLEKNKSDILTIQNTLNPRIPSIYHQNLTGKVVSNRKKNLDSINSYIQEVTDASIYSSNFFRNENQNESRDENVNSWSTNIKKTILPSALGIELNKYNQKGYLPKVEGAQNKRNASTIFSPYYIEESICKEPITKSKKGFLIKKLRKGSKIFKNLETNINKYIQEDSTKSKCKETNSIFNKNQLNIAISSKKETISAENNFPSQNMINLKNEKQFSYAISSDNKNDSSKTSLSLSSLLLEEMEKLSKDSEIVKKDVVENVCLFRSVKIPLKPLQF